MVEHYWRKKKGRTVVDAVKKGLKGQVADTDWRVRRGRTHRGTEWGHW